MSSDSCSSPLRTPLKDGVNFTNSLSPTLNRDFKDRGSIALTITVTNAFLRDLKSARNQSDLSYLDIINCQIKCFQLLDSERLQGRIARNASEVVSELKNKKGSARTEYLKKVRGIAVYENELSNVKHLQCTLDNFEEQSFQLEKRCSVLLETLQNVTDENFKLSYENSHVQISENSIKKKCESLEDKCDTLTDENNKLKSIISDQKDHVAHLKSSSQSLKSEIVKLDMSKKELQNQVSNLEKYIPHPRKQFDEITAKNKSRSLNTLATEAEKALWFSEIFGLTPKSIKFRSKENKDVTVSLDKPRYGQLDSVEKQKLRELTFILDKFGISDAAYHELSMLNDSLPRTHHIIHERASLNDKFHIERTPGEKPGAYVSIASEIENFICNNNVDSAIPLTVKLSGDGTRVSRISTFVLFTLSFPDIDNCVSVSNIKTIAIIKCKETYEELGVCAQPIFQEFNSLVNNPKIVVDGHVFTLNVVFNGDMKFVQLCLGLCGATGNYACAWCLVNKEERMDINRDSDFYASDKYKRTQKLLKENALTNTYGSKHMPLVDVEPEDIVPDELHMFIRIADILLQNIMDDCRQLDKIAAVHKRKPDHLERLVKAINECGVTFQTWVDASGIAQCTSLTGGDYQKLFCLLPSKLVFIINNKTYDETSFLIDELLRIKTAINSPSERMALFTRIHNWMECFQGLSRQGRQGYDRVTPYMHCLLYHVPAFVERFGGIGRFSGQGVEKMNDQIKQIHQKRSNKSDQTMDDLKIRKRMEYLLDSDCERNKQKYSKINTEWWDDKKRENSVSKKRRIEFEMKNAQENYEKENEKPISEMTIQEIKRKLKSYGITTKVRKLDKLIEMLHKAIDNK